MPRKPARGRGERRLGEALAALARALDGANLPWMVIGGIAVITRGVRRMTSDIDAVIRGDAVSAEALVKVLAREKIVPRVADAAAFAVTSQVLLMEHRPTKVELDLSFGWTEFEHDAIAASTTATYSAARAPFARAEDLVIFKAIAGRPQDVDDATTLLLMHPDIDLRRVRRVTRAFAEMVDDPSRTAALEQAIAIAAAARRASRRVGKPHR